MPTGISWTDEVWNPVTGCDPVSAGCDNCYAALMANRLSKIEKTAHKYRNKFDVTCHSEELDKHFGWKTKRVFVNSMSDIFHHKIPNEFIKNIFDTMRDVKNESNIFQILTKRPERYNQFKEWFLKYHYPDFDLSESQKENAVIGHLFADNIHFGVTAENQKYADKRIPQLLQIPAAVRFVSCEPLLEKIDLTVVGCPYCGFSINSWFPNYTICKKCNKEVNIDKLITLDWVIVGCESGAKRRPCELEWVYEIVDLCKQAEVPVFIKQLDIDGKVVSDIDKFPTDLQIREFPR